MFNTIYKYVLQLHRQLYLLPIILFFIVFILAPISFANIEINEIRPNMYNFGDKLSFIGTITRETSFNGLFRVNLVCKDNSIPFMSRIINVYPNQKYNFKEEFVIPNILTGECNLRSFLEQDKNTIEEKLTNSFSVTKELKGNFVLVNNRIQLGDDINVRGDVFKVNGKKINGVANVYFKKDNEILFIDTNDIKDGQFVFNIPSTYSFIGNYSFDFKVKDIDNNEKSFDEVIKFSITNLLNLNASLNKEQINPGDSFEVNGIIKDVYGNRVNKGTFIIKFEDKELKGNILSGDIYNKISTEDNIKSGFHNLIIEASDEFGNKGNSILSLNILPKADNINISIEKDSYKPEEKLNIKAFVFDQGGEIIKKDIKLEIRDSNNEKRFENLIETQSEFSLPLIAKPGEWLIRAISGNLKTEKKFYVSEIKEIDFNLQGQNLIILNKGNTRFNDIINLTFESRNYSLITTKKINLDSSKSLNLNLGNEVKTGLYKVIINERVFNNVNINGKKNLSYFNYNWLFIILTLIVLGFLVKIRIYKFKNSNNKNAEECLNDFKSVMDKFKLRSEEGLKKFKEKNNY